MNFSHPNPINIAANVPPNTINRGAVRNKACIEPPSITKAPKIAVIAINNPLTEPYFFIYNPISILVESWKTFYTKLEADNRNIVIV